MADVYKRQVESQADAMIRHPALWIIVCADSFRTVARSHLGTAVRSHLGILLGLFDLIYSGTCLLSTSLMC